MFHNSASKTFTKNRKIYWSSLTIVEPENTTAKKGWDQLQLKEKVTMTKMMKHVTFQLLPETIIDHYDLGKLAYNS